MGDTKSVFRRQVEAVNAHDVAALSEFYTDDSELIFTGRGPIKGREAIDEYFRLLLRAFPDFTLTVRSLIAEGEAFALEYEAAATHTGPWRLSTGGEIPPSGKAITTIGAIVGSVEDGKVKSQREYVDALELLRQLGLMPAMSRPPA